MQAVILAAGCGARMGRLTRRRPKALLSLAGRRLIDWQIAALAAGGITQVGVVSGHARDVGQWPAGLREWHNPDWHSSGPIASFRHAQPQQFDTVVLVYGDGVFHPDFARALRASTADVAITVDRRWHALWSRRFADVLADAESLRCADGQLYEIGARVHDLAAVQAQFTGLVRFSRQGWHAAEQVLASMPAATQARLDTTGLLAALLRHGQPVQTIDVDGRWCEVDSARDLALYRLLARRHPGWSHDWRWEPT